MHKSLHANNVMFKRGQVKLADCALSGAKIGKIERKLAQLKAFESQGLTNVKPCLLDDDCFDSNDQDPSYDIIALGSLMYELIVGEKCGTDITKAVDN